MNGIALRPLLFAGLTLLSIPVMAATKPPSDIGWPRQVATGQNVVTVYQPQVDKWDNYKVLYLRAAIGIRPKAAKNEILGVLEGTAQTYVDTNTRIVGLSNLNYTLRFPSNNEEESAKLEKAVRAALPGTRSLTVSLDRVITFLDKEHTSQQKEVKVRLDPPDIFYSSTPAVLMIFMGEPKFSPVKAGDNSLLYAVNTNWDLFQSNTDHKYYFLNDDSWLESSDSAAWTLAKQLPPSIQNLPDDENWVDVKKNIPGKTAKSVPAVFQTTRPAELIITDGPPQMRNIPNTQLMQVTNTPSLLLMNNADQLYYFLVAGRWFNAKQLEGPWQPATTALPEDFQNIPATDQVSEVRTSVKGTPEANDAVMLASVPTYATVPVSEASLEVIYEGEPIFAPIPGTQVQFAINTSFDVFLVGASYYCCSEGVWFCATAAKGPWSLCKQVDPAIYEIPVEHPKHNDTYVYVYDSGPDYVTYGYTGGYLGNYVYDDLLMYGAGIIAADAWDDWYDDWDDSWDDYYDHYPAYSPYYSYGGGAYYNYGAGGYYGGSHYYGPYGGAGRYGYYNPLTGGYARGAGVYGPRGSAGVREAYNPWTDTYAARAKVNTPYGSAGRFYAERGNDAIWGGSRSGPRGDVAWAETSEGGKGAAWDTRRNEGAAVKNKEGDVLVGNDGNIYKRQDGDWQKYENGGWNDVDRGDGAHPEPHEGGLRDRADAGELPGAGDRAGAGVSDRMKDVGAGAIAGAAGGAAASRLGNRGAQVGNQLPGTGDRAGAGNRGPSAGNQLPGTGDRAGAGNRGPSAGNQLPGTGDRAGAGNRGPSVGNQLPGTGDRAGAGNRGPSVGNQLPKTGTQRPSQRPTASTQPARKTSSVNSGTYSNLQRQSASRSRGNSNASQYKQSRSKGTSRSTSYSRPSSSSRSSSSRSSSNYRSSSQRSSSSYRSSPQRSSSSYRSAPSGGMSRGGGGMRGGGGRGRR